MSKRKPMDKAQARERRNRLLETAAAAELSLTEGVREMRAIAGMTQTEFAQHRGVSARVIKAIELGQGNPTVATLNQIGQFFGLEVAFVPVRREPADAPGPGGGTDVPNNEAEFASPLTPYLSAEQAAVLQESIAVALRKMQEMGDYFEVAKRAREMRKGRAGISSVDNPAKEHAAPDNAGDDAPARKKRKPRPS